MSQVNRIGESQEARRASASERVARSRKGWAIVAGVALVATLGVASFAFLNRPSSEPGSFAASGTGRPGHTSVDSEDLGILLGDSVVRGFGSSPVYYNDQGPVFHRTAYRFVASADKPVACLDGYEGIHKWLNRGVTANGTNATLARWSIDVSARLKRGAQTERSRVRCVLVSTGFMDIAQGVLRGYLATSEANMRKNLLLLVRRAKADKIRIAFLEIPNPTKAPLGQRFHTKAGTPVVPFYEEEKLNPQMRKQFTEAVQRYRSFLESTLAAEGAQIVDYASFLPTGYFWDSHHPSEPGYIKLGQLLAKRYPGPVLRDLEAN